MNIVNILRMVLRHPFFVFILLISSFNTVRGNEQNPIPKDLIIAYNHSINLEIGKSDSILKISKSNHPFKILIEDYNSILPLIIDEDFSMFDENEEKFDDRLDRLEEFKDKTNPWYNLVRAEMKFHWGIVNFKYGNEISSAWNINQAHSLIKENQKKFPNFTPNLKTLGLFHIVIGTLPDNYQWIMEKIGFKGDINLGISEMNKCSTDKNIFSEEASILNQYLKAHLQNDYINTISFFEDKYKQNQSLTYNYILTSLYTNNHQAKKAIELIENRPKNESLTFSFYNYKLANCYFQKGDYKMASSLFLDFIKKYKGKNYVKGAYYKLSLCHYFLGNKALKNQYFELIDDNGSEIMDEDKYAQKFYDEGKFPNQKLSKARYYSDGGFYEEALNELKSFTPKTANDKAELNYRYGRIYDLKGDYKKALDYYSKPLTYENDENLYFIPNSYLKAGIIYINLKDSTEARKMLHKAIDCKNHQYENSIEMKAKSLLKKIENESK